MSGIRELSFDEIAIVSGGNGADSADRDRALHAARINADSQASHAASAAASAATGAAGTAIGTLAFGPVGGVVGGIIGAALGSAGYDAAVSATNQYSGSGNKNSGSYHDTNPGSVAGQCTW